VLIKRIHAVSPIENVMASPVADRRLAPAITSQCAVTVLLGQDRRPDRIFKHLPTEYQGLQHTAVRQKRGKESIGSSKAGLTIVDALRNLQCS
jgi:hypothetical protein